MERHHRGILDFELPVIKQCIKTSNQSTPTAPLSFDMTDGEMLVSTGFGKESEREGLAKWAQRANKSPPGSDGVQLQCRLRHVIESKAHIKYGTRPCESNKVPVVQPSHAVHPLTPLITYSDEHFAPGSHSGHHPQDASNKQGMSRHHPGPDMTNFYSLSPGGVGQITPPLGWFSHHMVPGPPGPHATGIPHPAIVNPQVKHEPPHETDIMHIVAVCGASPESEGCWLDAQQGMSEHGSQQQDIRVGKKKKRKREKMQETATGGKRNNFSTCKAKAAATGPLLEMEAC
ncbi:hypothetical protein INR49_017019 [Caranx melampygus]|nr:hypothetical protein INR49_017019 [Caranx melampygus]